jgi:hypothetical protein
MQAEYNRLRRRTLAIALPFWATVVAFTYLGLSSSAALAQQKKAPENKVALAQKSKTPEKPFEDLDPAKFDRPTQITNEWMPLKPGTRLVYAGNTVDDDGKVVPRRFVMTVTDLTKVVGGVRSVISWDLDYSAGELVEAELAFYAQDNDGNVWHMGEYPEEYEKGKFVTAPAWLHGLEDARAGIAMLAKPQVGTPSYSQGWGPAVNWTDRGRVDQMGKTTCVPMGCYKDVLVVAETSQSEPNAEQLKYWVRGVGNVRVGWRGKGEKTKETLELVDIIQLSPEALAEVRAQALALEKHAYEISDMYRHTPPAEHTPGTRGK